MPWMWREDEEANRKLQIAYEYVIHITKYPYFLGEEYNNFLHEVWMRLREPPFYSNLSSVKEVAFSALSIPIVLYLFLAEKFCWVLVSSVSDFGFQSKGGHTVTCFSFCHFQVLRISSN